MENKKLLQINTVVNTGSTGRITEEIGQFVMEKGWASYIAYGRNDQPSKSELIKIGTEWDIRLHGLQTRMFDRHGYGSRKATQKLIHQINLIKPDIIHLHNLHGYYLNIELLFNYLSVQNIPIIWTLHDSWPFTGHCAYFSFIGCNKWKSACFKCPQKNIYPASLFFDNSATNYKLKKQLFNSVKNLTIVTVSNWLKEKVKQSFLKNYPILKINNGVNLNVFRPIPNSDIRAKYGLVGKQIILGCATKWGKRKGLYDFIHLNSLLNQSQQIVLVGLNKKQIRNLPKGMLGIERTENTEELAVLYSIADIFLSLSVEETFGLVCAEALACGTPIIVYNCTASPELVSASTGIIIEKGDFNGLTHAIKKLSAENQKELSKNCRSQAELLYDKDKIYMDYFKEYKSRLNL